MLHNYLVIALRNLLRHKTSSLLNISGLAIGIAACLLILQYVSFELSYDRFHTKAADIYRVTNDRYQNGQLVQHGTVTYSAVGKAMKDDYPEVLQYARVHEKGDIIISYGDKKLTEKRTLAVDNSFLEMFSFPLLSGNAATALKEPYTLVISESSARKIFSYQGNDFDQFIGKTLIFFRDEMPYKVTGICRNVPENSHLQFNILISYSTLVSSGWKDAEHSFTESSFWHYIQLVPGTDYKDLESRLDAFSKRHFKGVTGSEEKFFLQPLLRAHLYSNYEYEIGVVGNSTIVWGLFIVALLIITIAWVNYINMATAKAIDRAKEVGIRKVLGAHQKQLIFQFFFEAFLINCVSLLIALLLVSLFQPTFNHLLDRQLSLRFIQELGLGGLLSTLGFIGIMLIGIVASGFYPAFVLSSFKPVTVLKGNYSTSKGGITFRKVLVIGQLAATIILIAGSLMVYRQIKFMSEKELGLNMDQMLVVQAPRLTIEDSTFMGRVERFKESLQGLVHIKGATTSRNLPGDELGRAFNVRSVSPGDDTNFTSRLLSAYYDFIDVYGIKLLAGRKLTVFDQVAEWDKLHNLIINEKAAQMLGFTTPQEAIGKTILVFGYKRMDIVGVIADYHQKSLHSPIEPILLFPSYGNGDYLSVKVAPTDVAATLADIRKQYDTFFPGNVFEYFFLDEKFNRQYKDDQLFGKVFSLFAGFAVFVACLGLFALSLATTALRTKEIGVRKVLGAHASQILALLLGDFFKLIIIANLIAWPLAWYMIQNWLGDFTYRTQINWWVFLLSGTLALLVGLFTISFQSIKASLANPIKSLRND